MIQMDVIEHLRIQNEMKERLIDQLQKEMIDKEKK